MRRRRIVRDILIAIVLAVGGLLFTAAVVPRPELVSVEGWIGMGFGAFVSYLYFDHLLHASWDYAEKRGLRRFRGLMIALLLAAGTFGIFMGTIARYVPDVADAARFIRWITVGMLFVGGLTTWITWRVDDE